MEHRSGATAEGGAAIMGQGEALPATAARSSTEIERRYKVLQRALCGSGARRLQYIESRRLGEVTTTRRGSATKLGEGDATS